MQVRPQPGQPGTARRASSVVVLAATLAVGSTACLPEVDAPPPTTMPAAAPATTLVPIDLGGSSEIEDQPAEFTGPMLDGRELTVRSDDPNVRFVGDEPAEIRRITDLATDGECEQLHSTLEFWLDHVDADTDPDPDAAPVGPATTSQRASLFGRAAYDAIVFVGCT